MKKSSYLAAMAAMALAIPAWSQTITVTSPRAIDEWTIGSAYSVTWTRSGAMPDQVTIRLRVAGSDNSVPAAAVIANDAANSGAGGTYRWTIPASVAPGRYFIRVKTTGSPDGTPEVGGDSPDFSIRAATPEGTIHVSVPNLTSVWPQGSDQAILWQTSRDLRGLVSITLRREGAAETDPPAARIADGCANNGRRVWRVPDSLAPGRYFVRVRFSQTIQHDSPVFAVTAAGATPGTAITVTQPLVGDRWCIGEERAITWTKSGTMHESVSISLRSLGSYESQPDAVTITGNTANDGDFRFWRIPASLRPDMYFIRIRTNERGSSHVSGESGTLTICAAGEAGTAAPGVHADLELAGAGVEYAGGNIVAWVKNNGPDNVFQDVKFMLNFPDQRGGGHYITRRINVPAGQERSIGIQPLSAWDIPQDGLRTILSIETSRSGIHDSRLMNQHRSVRLGCPDVRVSVPRGSFKLYRLYGMGGKDFRVEARIRVLHDGPRPLNDVRIYWRIDTPNGGLEYASGSFLIDNLAPNHPFEREITRTFGDAERSNSDRPALRPGSSYRFWARFQGPEHRFNDPNPDNDRDNVLFSVPD